MATQITLAYDSINHYLAQCRDGWVLIDAGWAGTLPRLQANLGRHGIRLPEVKYVLFTHGHPDHAALTQEVKRAAGARLLIHERQIPFLEQLQAFYQRKGGYTPILVERDDLVTDDAGSRATLRAIGVDGEVVATPGHSDDSVSLVLDTGAAFTGDLYLPLMVEEARREVVSASWRALLDRGAHTIYPGHTPPFPAKDIQF